jgi:prepilin-type N-terminal cleavage/methylation domain-containing protein
MKWSRKKYFASPLFLIPLMSSRFLSSHSGFTLVELIVGMTIFAIGLTGIYGLLSGVL